MPTYSRIPLEPGLYHWDEWNQIVKVYKKNPKSKDLFVFPPGKGSVELKITPRIAGRFTPL